VVAILSVLAHSFMQRSQIIKKSAKAGCLEIRYYLSTSISQILFKVYTRVLSNAAAGVANNLFPLGSCLKTTFNKLCTRTQ